MHKFYFVASILSWLIPKKKRKIAFLPLHNPGVKSGNLLSLYSETQKHNDNLVCNWILFSVKYRSLWNLLRAELIVVDAANVGFSLGRFRFFQLWHGTGFKRINILNEQISGQKKILRKLFNSKTIAVIASSSSDKSRKIEAFKTENVFITGSPRNDFLFKNTDEIRDFSLFNYSSFKEIILYAPTFRENSSIQPFSSKFLLQFNEKLKKKKSLFMINRHPRCRKQLLIDNYSNIIDVTGKVSDIQLLLHTVDVLVTDYSSISTDFSLLKKPILFYMYDYQEYITSSRGLYYDLEKVLPGPFLVDEKELETHIFDRNWFNEEIYQNSYQKFINFFFDHQDGNSSHRTYKLLKTYLK